MGSTYYVLHYYEHQRGFSKSLLLDPPFSYTAIAISQISNISKFGCKTRIKILLHYTAILYRASTGPEQGSPCEVFHTGKNLFSLQGTPVLIAGSLFSLQVFPCKPLYFPVRDCSADEPNYFYELKF